MEIAFLGLGRMGTAMARHVLAAGHHLTVWNRSPGRADELVAEGAVAATTPAAAARGADAVVLMLYGPESVREVLFGPDGVGAGARPGTLVVDATTIGPRAAREIGAEAAARGLRYVDAPVAGSLLPAREGTLGVLAGGADADVTAARPLLELWGDPERVRHVGEVGAGSAAKLVGNLTLGVALEAVGEALRLGHDMGLDRRMVLGMLAQGPIGGVVGYKRAMLESEEYGDTQFSVDLLGKDLALCLENARRDLPATAATAGMVEEAVAAGHGDDDIAALAGYLGDEGTANSY